MTSLCMILHRQQCHSLLESVRTRPKLTEDKQQSMEDEQVDDVIDDSEDVESQDDPEGEGNEIRSRSFASSSE